MSGLFGGNSNWRGPIWMPVNYLLIESLQKFHYYFGDEFKVECPVGFRADADACGRSPRRFRGGWRPSSGAIPTPDGGRCSARTKNSRATRPGTPYPFFHEYFHADEGRGCGASHQTGWTGLIAKLLQQTGEYDELDPGRLSDTRSKRTR